MRAGRDCVQHFGFCLEISDRKVALPRLEYGGIPKIRGKRGPNNKEYRILWSKLGSPYLGKLSCSLHPAPPG